MKFAKYDGKWYEHMKDGWTGMDGKVITLPADHRKVQAFPDEAAAIKAGFVRKATVAPPAPAPAPAPAAVAPPPPAPAPAPKSIYGNKK